MKSENKNKTLESELILLKDKERDKMPYPIQRFWQDLQRELRLKMFSLIDFQAKDATHNFWFWNLAIPSATSANKILRSTFKNKKAVPKNWLTEFKKLVIRKGFFIPQPDIVHLGKTLLQNHLVVQQKLHADFPFEQYLFSLLKKKQELDAQKIPLPIVSIWEHFHFYIIFLKEVYQTDFHAVKSFKKILNVPISAVKFNQKLPSEQLIQMFYIVVNQHFCETFEEHSFKKLIDKSSPAVQRFWEKRSRYFIAYFENFFKSNPYEKQYDIFSTNEIEEDFYEICQTDLEYIQFQEIMDNASQFNFINFFPEPFKEKYGKERKISLAEKMKKAIGEASILERIQSLADQNNPDPQPTLSSENQHWIIESQDYWYELEESEQSEFRAHIKDSLDEIQFNRLQKSAQNRWNLHLQNIMNDIFAPFLNWQIIDQQWIPQFNLMPERKAKKLMDQFDERIRQEIAELGRLKHLQEELYRRQTLHEIREYTRLASGFKIKYIEEKWNDSVSAHILNVKNRENYRLRRMQEFGILEGEEIINRRKHIWLDEMLSIEKEIRPYILFVKNAFQGALPIRKTVEFHPFRHSFDGVEFDPETIQDQEKWLNGEVMKSLRIKVDKEPVEQINAFALDSSGSMKHEKMRNLFKLCYLLVVGLEDRKTYDAFHFFSTYFIETANFSHDYTNRSLLFKVLRNISKIKDGKVIYEGKGGTNISAGVVECHQRIQNFIQEKNFNQSGKKYLTSIFVITDGEPSAGILDIDLLRKKIEEKRNETNTAIKGIYIKPKGEESMFMEQIFGPNKFVETEDFENAIEQFIQVMTSTYKQQRRVLKKAKKRNYGAAE